MLVEVHRPYVDVSAGDLSLTLGAPAAPAIEVLRVTVGGFAVQLRLLGFSHQALVEGLPELSEMVACVPGVPGELPPRHTNGGYDFRARVERHAGHVYAARAAAVLAGAAENLRALVGLFAGDPGAGDGTRAPMPAFTALAAHPLTSGRGIGWTTWHGYPQTGEIVVTTSTLEHPG